VKRPIDNLVFTVAGVGVTFILVCIAWTFFRATSVESAFHLVEAMLGGSGIHDGADELLPSRLYRAVMVIGALIIWFAPNTEQILGRLSTSIDTYSHRTERSRQAWWQWRPTIAWGVFSVVALGIAAALSIESPERFLYFQF
jgi:alginate O-acetyltransferase complex protein AlgI